VIITGRSSDIVTARAKELKITELHQGVSDKLAVLASIAAEYGVTPDQIAYIGDDLNDLDAMSYCGFTACPADAVDTVRKAAKYVCKANGGRGAVREFVEYLLALM
jgi:3-deoxy-D-manno-octulosonate 8-phosphate phosphatase (KDO 8-P phosphatase)